MSRFISLCSQFALYLSAITDQTKHGSSLGRGGGLEVSDLAYRSEEPSSNHAGCKNVALHCTITMVQSKLQS